MNIKPYFNEKSMGTFGPGRKALIGVLSTSLLLASGAAWAAAVAVPIAAGTVGQMNLWQEAAKGKPLWTPSSKTLGL
jgi:hypothetical protein